jgi:hypothetical protein
MTGSGFTLRWDVVERIVRHDRVGEVGQDGFGGCVGLHRTRSLTGDSSLVRRSS